jgi:hypothetical protein
MLLLWCLQSSTSSYVTSALRMLCCRPSSSWQQLSLLGCMLLRARGHGGVCVCGGGGVDAVCHDKDCPAVVGPAPLTPHSQ